MPSTVEDTTQPGLAPAEETYSQWLRCQFVEHGCRWAGVMFQPGQLAGAQDIRDAHERHCRFRFVPNL